MTNVLTSWATLSFRRRTPLHVINVLQFDFKLHNSLSVLLPIPAKAVFSQIQITGVSTDATGHTLNTIYHCTSSALTCSLQTWICLNKSRSVPMRCVHADTLTAATDHVFALQHFNFAKGKHRHYHTTTFVTQKQWIPVFLSEIMIFVFFQAFNGRSYGL